jgi:Tfp pilus assembly protein PilZ
VRVKCRATIRGDRSWVFSVCENISEGGFYIRDLGNEVVGNIVKLEMELPDRDYPLVAEGRVVWQGNNGSGNGGGLAFTRILKSDRKWLSDFVKKMSALESEG